MNGRAAIEEGGPERRAKPRLWLCAALWLCAGVVAEADELLTRPFESDPGAATQAAVIGGGEVVHLRWKLGGFLGALAGLFIPNSGEGVLTFIPAEEDRVQIQLLITAPKRKGEYFLYGAEVNERSGTALAAWSSQVFRGERRDREEPIVREDLVDYASAIYRLRWNPPSRPTRMTIWSGGKTYPIDVEPLAPARRKIGGEKIEVRGYKVRGAKVGGERAFDDKIDIYFANDERATPVEIIGKRGLIKTRIQMVGAQGAARPPGGGGETQSSRAGRAPAGAF